MAVILLPQDCCHNWQFSHGTKESCHYAEGMALRTVSVILVEPVSPFEFCLAVEVFGLDRSEDGIEPLDFRVCTERPGVPLKTKNIAPFTITATDGLDAVAGSDLVVMSATLPRMPDRYSETMLQTVRDAYDEGATILSLCSGSFALGAAGLLDGRNCTTHWMYFDAMERMYPKIKLDRTSLYVQDGRIVTSAGTAAGIDASLHLVRAELGTKVANKIARRMVVPPIRDGGQQQFVDLPIPENAADSLAPTLSWVLEHLDQRHTAATMAKRAMMSERTFARRFVAEVGTTPHKWLIQQRVLAARTLLEESEVGIEQIADRVGFNSAVVLRDHFRRQVGLAPVDYRRRFVA